MSVRTGLYWTFKKGSIGKVLRGTLRDGNGDFEITGTLTVTAKRVGASDPVIDAIACTPDADQVTNKGKFTFILDSTAANIDKGTYNLEFAHTEGGNTFYWPDDAKWPYGKLVVTAGL